MPSIIGSDLTVEYGYAIISLVVPLHNCNFRRKLFILVLTGGKTTAIL